MTGKVMPSRLVDLGENGLNPKVVKSAELPDTDKRFVFLSYVFGNGSMNNHEQFKAGKSSDTVPQLYRDMFLLCRRLGYRYVFLDSLCIVQDDSEAVLNELDRMGPSYIASAELVLNRCLKARQSQRTNGHT
jgi:hypothetical protein